MKKIDELKKMITAHKSVAVLFSGGVDSSFLLKLCVDLIGAENVIAITGISESYTPLELKRSKKLAQALRIEHIELKTSELSNPEFCRNTPNRCYYCKKELFNEAVSLATAKNIEAVFDGTNFDDAADYRPGRKAAAEAGILSPLLEACLTKEDIRKLSKDMGLETWNAVQNPCLASRIPYGNDITAEKLKAVRQAEEFIRTRGFRELRVRHHGEMARIEVSPEEIPRLCNVEIRNAICQYLKSLGFTWVAIDMQGYRRGSLNEVILPRERA